MQKQFPTPFQRKTLWRALTGVAILVLSGLLVGLIWLFSLTLGYLQPVLIPLAVAGIVAYLLDPVVAWFQAKGMSRLRAVLCVFGSFVCAAMLFAAIIVPPIVGEIGSLVQDRHKLGSSLKTSLGKFSQVPGVSSLVEWSLAPQADPATSNLEHPKESNPEELTSETPKSSDNNNGNLKGETSNTSKETPVGIKPTKEEEITVPFAESNLGALLSENSGNIASIAKTVVTKSAGTILGYFGLLIGFIMIPIYLYYFLKESSAIKENWHNYVPLKASQFKTEVVDTLQEINGYLIAFFRGQVLVAFIDGVLVGIALMIFGLPYGLVIGVIMAFLGVIPFIGNLLCLIPACLIAYIHFSVTENQGMLGDSPWAYVGAVIAIFFIVQQINSLVTAPKIVGDSVGLHPMTVIFSMLFWSLILGGFVGALLAVPLTAAVKVIFVRYIWERKIMEPDEPTETDSEQEQLLADQTDSTSTATA